MITRDTIDQIIAATRIEEVVGDYVTLRRRGVNLLGLCPFHNEKTPSFTVSPVKGIYKCFGCGKAGNAVNFLMEHEHFTYPEALRYLAKKYQIEIDEEEQSPEQIQEINEKESLYSLNLFAQQFFSKTLHETEEGKAIGLTYFKERGIREDLIKKFQLGYNPERWDAFTGAAISAGYKKEYLIKTGLSIEKEERLYDRFHARVMFPIHSASGRVLGFGGRVLGGEKNRAKYVNSPESDIYNKSKTLYGIFFARNAVASHDNCLLVEGYTDVISLHQAGIEHVVASSGTSLTYDQIRTIQRYTANITILYDGDTAGIKASFRGIDMIVEQGMNVRVVLFPEGEDPDSFARNHHPNEVQAFISQHADNFILFKTKLLINETKGDPIKKATLIKEIVQTISLIPDAISRSLYIKECAAIMLISEQAIVTELNKILRARFKQPDAAANKTPDQIEEVNPTAPPQVEIDPNSSEFQEKEIIRMLLLYGQRTMKIKTNSEDATEISVLVSDYVTHDIQTDELSFDSPLFAKIYAEFQLASEKDTSPDRLYFLSHSDPEISQTAIDLIFTPYELSNNWLKNSILVETEENRLKMHVEHALLAFKAKKIDKTITELQNKLTIVSSPEEQTEILETLKALKRQSIRINNSGLGRIITR